ncbi:MAG: OmpA family protein [Bosea sp. (in: a-proteobacteria)]
MCQPKKWWWGLIPLALLWIFANWMKAEPVRSDVAAKATAAAAAAAGATAGLKPAAVTVVGRDVTIAGETLAAAGAAKALADVDGLSGVRRADGALSVITAQKPYTWAAAREGQKVTLSGFVPDEATKKANAEAAAKAFTGATVDDQQKIAFGAPAGFAAMAALGIPELAKLSAGRTGITDDAFCFTGSAATSDSYLDVIGKVATPAAGFKKADCAVTPPTVTPYVWGAEKAATGAVTLTGLYPTDAARAQINAAARATLPAGTSITDSMKPALGAPAALVGLATKALGDLASLQSGRVGLSGTTYTIAGQGPATFAACTALKTGAANVAGGTLGSEAIACPPPPPPPAPPAPVAAPAPAPTPGIIPPPVAAAQVAPPSAVVLNWAADKSATGIALSGLVPSDAAKAALRTGAAASVAGGTVTDTLRTEGNLRTVPDYNAATAFALAQLRPMTTGNASIADTALTVTGVAPTAAVKSAIEAAVNAASLPGGLRLARADISVRPDFFEAEADKSGAVLRGYLPDAVTKADILARFEGSPLRGLVRDETVLLSGAPANFGTAARTAVTNLLRLDIGSARVSDQTSSIQGLTCRDLIKSEVETGARAGQPSGFAGQAVISLRQTGCVVDAPNTCQADLDALTKRNAILFQQSRSELGTDAGTQGAVNDLFAILQKCPTAAIAIEGHANFDGQRGGYNNLALSEARAAVVKAELVKRGIAAARLTAKGFSVDRPLVPHGTAEAQVKNRRVQFTVAK